MNGDSKLTEVAREPEIVSSFDEQENQIQYLGELVERAFTRFNSVLRSEPAPGIDDKNKETESTVPLVTTIKSKTDRLKDINRRLDSFLNLCEL